MKPVQLTHEPLSTEAQELIELGMERLKEAGFKLTKKRQEILSLFAVNQRYMTALNIHSALQSSYPTMSYNTTYRNLYDFVDVGILETTEYQQEQLFRYSCHPHQEDHHHHHFICTNCGYTIQLDACPLDHVTTDLSHVTIQSHRFEVFGLCEDCQDLLAKETAKP